MINKDKTIWLVSSGDQRETANIKCWPTQEKMEKLLAKAVEKDGYSIKRAHNYMPENKHGFINSQKMGIEVFRRIPDNAPIIIAESLWQYSAHILPGLFTHQGPILTIANWEGLWPGLVGLLNLNGSLTKAGISYSTLWSENFSDFFFESGLNDWLITGYLRQDQRHVQDIENVKIPIKDDQLGRAFARKFRKKKAIIGVFDEGCMGMYNAIVPDLLLNKVGIFKERLSQSTLYARIQTVTENEANLILEWLLKKGMHFNWGEDESNQLTKKQTLEQCKMYIAATRIADELGCEAIGIQYQQGLMDLVAASDLAEGLLNNTDRPPVHSIDGRELYPGKALPHFNEVDECAGLDALVTYHLWNSIGMVGDNTLHDIRWGEYFRGGEYIDDFVWLFMISGAVPTSHFENGYSEAVSERQPPMFFKSGGGTIKGISKPGHFVWSRIYIMKNKLHCDIGVGESLHLPKSETIRRWNKTNTEWPIMHAVLSGISRDQMMARHKSNHIQIVYANNEHQAHKACRIKASALSELGILVHFCGEVDFAGEIFE